MREGDCDTEQIALFWRVIGSRALRAALRWLTIEKAVARRLNELTQIKQALICVLDSPFGRRVVIS